MNGRDFSRFRRLVVKVGSSSITHTDGQVHWQKMEHLTRQIADLVHAGREVVLVSSGAVAAGLAPLGFREKPARLEDKQAAAAVGQGILIHRYEKLFRESGIPVGQVLLTRGDYLHPRRYVNARETLQRLLQLGAVPVVNENDTVATDELKVGDNDTLSAMVASIIDADCLLILSDVDGLYTANPQRDPAARLISRVDKITPAMYASAQGVGSARGTGGMTTKLQAAEICVHSGVHMLIAKADTEHVLTRLAAGEEIGTWFVARDVHPQMRKRKLLFGAAMKGKIYVDDGCCAAVLESGSSILPVGIREVEGEFVGGDGVSVYHGKEEIARGIVAFDSAELRRICGVHTADLAAVLGYEPEHNAAVHRNYLVVKS